MTRPTLKERQLQLREDAVLETTHHLLTTKGYQAMTMDDVANEVGISKATLYQHFKSKEELTASVINQQLMALILYIQELDSSLPTLGKLRLTLSWIVARRFGDGSMRMFQSEASIIPYLQNHAEYRRREQMLIDALAELIDAAKSEGQIAAQFSTRVMVQVIFSCLRDATYEILLEEGRCTTEEVLGTLMGMFCCTSSAEHRLGEDWR